MQYLVKITVEKSYEVLIDAYSETGAKAIGLQRLRDYDPIDMTCTYNLVKVHANEVEND